MKYWIGALRFICRGGWQKTNPFSWHDLLLFQTDFRLRSIKKPENLFTIRVRGAWLPGLTRWMNQWIKFGLVGLDVP